MKYIRFLQELRKEDLPLAGGKGANLGELVTAGLRVPQGFVLTVDGYRRCVPSICPPTLVIEDLIALEKFSSKIQSQILSIQLPEEVETEIIKAYRQMGSPPVAVRSSATAEDLPNASFAGQQETFLNVLSEDQLIIAVKKCWASLWSSRAIHYRANQGFGDSEVALAVILQEMAPHEVSGIAFTANPLSGKADELVINGAPGLGEAIVQGEIIPDQWIARKPDGAVLQFNPAPRPGQIPGFATRYKRPARGCLTTLQVRELAGYCLRIEEHYGGIPQDIEWSYGGGTFYLLQSRPITTL